MTGNWKWRPKPEILISLKLWKVKLKFQRHIWGIRPCMGGKECWQVSATTTDTRKYRYGPQNRKQLHLWDTESVRNSNANFRILDDVELDRRLTKRLRQRSTTRNCKIGGKTSIVPFPVVSCCCNRPGSVSSSWAWSKTPNLPLELLSYLS